MSILRSLDRCQMNLVNVDRITAVRTVVGVLCDLCWSASSTLTEIFNEIRQCCSVKRERNSTQVLMFIITDHLGEIHKEVSSLWHSMRPTDITVNSSSSWKVFANSRSSYSVTSFLMSIQHWRASRNLREAYALRTSILLIDLLPYSSEDSISRSPPCKPALITRI